MNEETLRNRLTHELHEIRGDTPAPAQARRSMLRWILWSAGVIAIFAYLVLTRVPLRDLVHELLSCNPWWLAAAVVAIVATRTVMSLKWWVILRGEGIRLPFRYVWHVTFVSYFLGSLAPSGLGLEAVRVWYLSRDHGIGAVAMASAVIDRAISVAALAIVALVALLALPQSLPGEELMDAGAAALLVAFIVATFLAPSFAGWLEAHRPTTHTSWLRRIWRKAHGVALSASKMQARKDVVTRALLLGVLVQILRTFEVYLVFVALGYPHLFGDLLALVPIVMFVAMVPVGLSPVAISAAAFVLLLGPMGVPGTASLSASLIVDTLGYLMIPIGAIAFWADRRGAQDASASPPARAA